MCWMLFLYLHEGSTVHTHQAVQGLIWRWDMVGGILTYPLYVCNALNPPPCLMYSAYMYLYIPRYHAHA